MTSIENLIETRVSREKVPAENPAF
jgi:hypothetical protein